MGAYILRRILISIPVLLGITIISFVALKSTPGDPLLTNLNPDVLARLLANPAILAQERHQLGLDLPLPIQYFNWLGGVLQGDFGYSIVSRRSVASEIGPRIPQTVALIFTSYGLAVLVGVPIGVITAVKQYSKFDYSLNFIAVFFASIPVFVLGLLAIYTFAVRLHWLPTGGLHSTDNSSLSDAAVHLILPAAVLALVNGAAFVRYTRASMLDVLTAEYVTTAKSKGLSTRLVILRHGLRNGIIPVITLVALLIPDLLGGAVITEQIFNWNGMGSLVVQAANTRDPAEMMAIVLMAGTAVILGNLLADVAYAVADPRIRYFRAR